MSKKWKGLAYWKKGGTLGLLTGIILTFLSLISLYLEIGTVLPLQLGAFLFQKMDTCQDAPCAFIIIPFSIMVLMIFMTLLGILISFIIQKMCEAN